MRLAGELLVDGAPRSAKDATLESTFEAGLDRTCCVAGLWCKAEHLEE